MLSLGNSYARLGTASFPRNGLTSANARVDCALPALRPGLPMSLQKAAEATFRDNFNTSAGDNMAVRAWRFALAGTAAIAALGVPVHVLAAGPITKVDKSLISSVANLPPGLDTTPVTVVVLLAGDPVAVV